MTREDVLSGMQFRLPSKTEVFVANPDSDDTSQGYLSNKFGLHECNVSSFGPYAMHWYTFVMGRKVSGVINYKSLEPYVKAPEADASR